MGQRRADRGVQIGQLSDGATIREVRREVEPVFQVLQRRPVRLVGRVLPPGGDHDQPYFYSSPVDWARTLPLASLVSRLARGHHNGAIFGGEFDGQLAIEAPQEDES